MILCYCRRVQFYKQKNVCLWVLGFHMFQFESSLDKQLPLAQCSLHYTESDRKLGSASQHRNAFFMTHLQRYLLFYDTNFDPVSPLPHPKNRYDSKLCKHVVLFGLAWVLHRSVLSSYSLDVYLSSNFWISIYWVFLGFPAWVEMLC